MVGEESWKNREVISEPLVLISTKLSDQVEYYVSTSPHTGRLELLSPPTLYSSLPSRISSCFYTPSVGNKVVWLPRTVIKSVSHHHLALFLLDLINFM